MLSRNLPAIAIGACALAVFAANAAETAETHPLSNVETPQQLIKDVVFNEQQDHLHHGYFLYLDEKRTGGQTVVKAEVETKAGRISRVLVTDGKPLTAEQHAAETRRLEALMQDQGQKAKLLRDYQGDEDRIGRIVALLPEGFLYQADGVEGEDIRLSYSPNPAFKPPTYEARVFHGMAGKVWINARTKRLSRLEGRLVSNVDFGYGLLGRLDKGGTFDMQRVEVAPGNWKTHQLDVHITGHVILLKSIGKDQVEVRSEFRQMPSDITLRQAQAVLNQRAGDGTLESARLEPAKVSYVSEKTSGGPGLVAKK